MDAIYHCAANVNHVGHYRDFCADNVTATGHLLSLATQRKAHHIESVRLDRLADFITMGDEISDIRVCDFGTFLKRLEKAIDQRTMDSAVAETVESFRLVSGHSPARQNQPVVISDRTQLLLEKFGITWPAIPAAGRNALIRAAVNVLHL